MGLTLSEAVIPTETAKVVNVLTRPTVEAPADTVPEPSPEEAEREIVFALQDLEVRYNGITAVRGVTLEVAAKEITAFIGPR